jgi:hypothetical protein
VIHAKALLHIPYVDIGREEETRCLWDSRRVPDMDTGEDLPDSSGEPSDSSLLEGVSKSPVALALDEPMAGAAFWPVVPPTCSPSTARMADEFDVETIDSVGLPGRSAVCGNPTGPGTVGLGCTGEARELPRSLAFSVAFRDEFDALIVVSLRRRSSIGVVLLPRSTLETRLERDADVPSTCILPCISDIDLREIRDDRGLKSEARVFKNTV